MKNLIQLVVGDFKFDRELTKHQQEELTFWQNLSRISNIELEQIQKVKDIQFATKNTKENILIQEDIVREDKIVERTYKYDLDLLETIKDNTDLEGLKVDDSIFNEFKFWKILINEGVLSKQDICIVKDIQKNDSSNLDVNDIILDQQLASEFDVLYRLYKFNQRYFEDTINKIVIDYNKLQEIKSFDLNMSRTISSERKHVIFNINEDKKIVFIRVSSVLELSKLNETKKYYESFGYKVKFYATTMKNIILCQKNIYGNEKEIKNKLDSYLKNEDFGSVRKDYFSLLIEARVLENVSDIWLKYDTNSKHSKIYFRINREKVYRYYIPTQKLKVVISNIENGTNMERGKIGGHQDGNMVYRILENKYPVNLRINSISVMDGKNVAIRIQEGDIEKIEQLGLETEDIDIFKNILSKDNGGIVCLSGVTGSGKSSTIRRFLNTFDFHKKNIITMENPVEVVMKGINHIEMNEKRGQSFKDSIKRRMRQAPDILVIGEVRDEVTCNARVERRTTGHLVFTTIHRNGVEIVEDRLKQLGIENTKPFMDQLQLSMYQKLVKEDNKMSLKYEYKIKNKDKVDRGIQETLK